jgi:hypothetical protein
MGTFWVWATGIAFIVASISLLVSGILLARVLSALLPLLDTTRTQVQDLGDLTANTVGRAADTADMVEIRVSQAMGQAAQAGSEATQQVLGVGSALAGLYLVVRIVQTARGYFGSSRRRRFRRRR